MCLSVTGQMVAIQLVACTCCCCCALLLLLSAAAAAAAAAAQLQGEVTTWTTVAIGLCNHLCTSSHSSHTDT
jgi:hypothetical protein